MTLYEIENFVLAHRVDNFPPAVPIQARLEIIKAQLTLAYWSVNAMAPSIGLHNLYMGESNGAAAMLRCLPEYEYKPGVNGVMNFDKPWAKTMIAKHFDLLQDMISEMQEGEVKRIAAAKKLREEGITVDAKALCELLEALNGPPVLMREIAATRSLHALGHTNCIETLIEQYNAQQKG